MSHFITYRYCCQGREPGQDYFSYWKGKINGPPGYPWQVYESVVRRVKQDFPQVTIDNDLPKAVKLTQAKRFYPEAGT